MQLFLCLDGCECVKDLSTVSGVPEGKASDVVGNVFDQRGEKGNFKKLVKGDKAERSKVISCQSWWGWSIRKSTMSLRFDVVESLRWVIDVGESIGKWKGEWIAV
jgi:hypothetical protein